MIDETTRMDSDGFDAWTRRGLGKLKRVAVFCAAREPRDVACVRAVEDLAAFMARNGIRLVYGGTCAGMMGRLARSVIAKGGEVTGVFARCIPERLLEGGLTETVIVDTLAERKTKMIELSDASIGLPGGAGTIDELGEALALRFIEGSAGYEKPVGLYNVGGYFDSLLSFFDHARDAGFSRRSGRRLFASGYTAREVFQHLVHQLPDEIRRKMAEEKRLLA